MPLRVFIAEDNNTALASLAELLVATCEVEVVGTARSELEVAEWLISRRGACDLIITDLLLLPGGSGFGVIQHAKSLSASTKVAVFSDFVTPAVAQRCTALGSDAVFNKSQLEQFLDYVRSQSADVAGVVG